MNINISKKVFAPIYLKNNILENDDRYLICYGGAGSGKSFFLTQKHIYRMLAEKEFKLLVIRKYAVTLKDSVFALFKTVIESWGLSKYFKITKSPMEIICLLNGNQIIFKGLDDSEKIKSIAGITSIWVEEANEISQEDFQQLDLRLRGKTKGYKQICISFNPVSENHWLKKYFFDEKVPSTTILKTTYLDNPFLDESYKQALNNLKEKDYNYWNVYANGNWGQLGKLVYTNYEIKDFDESTLDNFYWGCDFGFNDESAYVKIAFDKKRELIYVCEEFKQAGLTNTDLIEKMKKQINKRDFIICDSAEPDRILEIKRAGFRNARGTVKGPGFKNYGIDWIKSKKIIIHPTCSEFIKEIQSYQYMKDRKNDKYLDKPQDGNDHLMDAFLYSLNLEITQNKNTIKSGADIRKMLGL